MSSFAFKSSELLKYLSDLDTSGIFPMFLKEISSLMALKFPLSLGHLFDKGGFRFVGVLLMSHQFLMVLQPLYMLRIIDLFP